MGKNMEGEREGFLEVEIGVKILCYIDVVKGNIEGEIFMQANDIKKMQSLKDADLVNHAKIAAQEERQAGIKLLWMIREIESRVLFSEWGYKSLLDFCVRELGISETSALRRIRSARLLAEVPQVEKKIEEGKLNISHLTEVQSLLQQEEKNTGRKRTKEEKKEILEKIEETSLREAGKILEGIFTLPDQEESKPRKRERVKNLNKVWREVSFLADQNLVEKLERIQDLVAHRKISSIGEVVVFMVEVTLEKIDPMKRVQRSEEKEKRRQEREAMEKKLNDQKKEREKRRREKEKRDEPKMERKGKGQKEKEQKVKAQEENERNETEGMNKARKDEDENFETPIKEEATKKDPTQHQRRSRYTIRKVENALWKRSQGKCEGISKVTGKRCNSTYKLELGHIKPFALGGEQSLENMLILCYDCNKRDAIRFFGREVMRNYYSN